jgi:hypothetical protein
MRCLGLERCTPRAARTGNAATTGGIFGKNDTFDSAMAFCDLLGKSRGEVMKRSYSLCWWPLKTKSKIALKILGR